MANTGDGHGIVWIDYSWGNLVLYSTTQQIFHRIPFFRCVVAEYCKAWEYPTELAKTAGMRRRRRSMRNLGLEQREQILHKGDILDNLWNV